ncbi:hypothetical protein [Kitasatospora sp. NPDC085464]|uniref:hypothetical protein n=1 Tax=Kitasatospora sp. NPDC085464 TaxID=3364063 RepID=UPI0037C527DE
MDLTVVAEITDDSATASVLLTTGTVRAHDPSSLTWPSRWSPCSGCAPASPRSSAPGSTSTCRGPPWR